MALKVTYQHDAFPKGMEVAVDRLGVLKNGEPTTISKEDEEAFVAEHGMSVKEAFKDYKNVKVEGTAEASKSGGDD